MREGAGALFLWVISLLGGWRYPLPLIIINLRWRGKPYRQFFANRK